MGERDPVSGFLWWSAIHQGLFRGYGLAMLVYVVVDADLDAMQLVLLGAALEASVLLAEVPTGLVADTFSRTRSIVISHLVMGAAFVATGLTTDFVLLLLTQVGWGVGWTFMSGADIAWITDELDEPGRIDVVLATRVRYQLVGSVVGMAAAGALGATAGLDVAMGVFGVALIGLGVAFGLLAREDNFSPVTEDRGREAREIFSQGVRLVRTDHQVLVVLGATLAIASGSEAVDRLFGRRLVDLGLPDALDPVVWFSLVTILGLLAGAVAVRRIEQRIDEADAPRRYFLVGTGCAIVGTLLLAWAPSVTVALVGVFVVRGLGWVIIPTVATIWVNRRATNKIRATVHSFLGQADALGQIGGGLALGVVAQATSLTVALTGSVGLFVVAFVIVARSRAGPTLRT